MADLRITSLDAITAIDRLNDVIAIEDVSVDETKKVTIKEINEAPTFEFGLIENSLYELLYAPADRTGTYANALGGSWWAEQTTWFQLDERLPLNLKINATAVGSFKVALFTLSGLVSTKIVETTLTDTTIGVKTYVFSDIFDLTALNASTKYYVFVQNSTNSPIRYTANASPGGYFINILDETALTTYDLNLNVWIEYYDLTGVSVRLDALDGIATSFDLATELAAKDDIFIPIGTWTINTTVVVASGKRIRGVPGKSILQAGASVTKVLDVTGSDILIDGIKIIGTYSNPDISSTALINSDADVLAENGAGTKYGIHLNGGERIIVKNCFITNFDYCGIYLSATGTNWIDGVSVTDCYVQNSYIGMKCGTIAEYSKISNNSFNLNVIGLVIASGNLLFTNNSATKNRMGVVIRDGTNDSHGSISNIQVNHCNWKGLLISGITFGMIISGIQSHSGSILINAAAGGVIISSSQLYSGISITNGGGVSIVGCVFSSGTPTLSGTTYVKMAGNIYADGADNAAINN